MVAILEKNAAATPPVCQDRRSSGAVRFQPLRALKRHPFAVRAFFRRVLVLTLAFEPDLLASLLPPGLSVDTCNGRGYVAVAMVQTQALRPAGFPAALGQRFFLAGYRIFARLRLSGRTLRGLYILRSDTDRRRMVALGNLFTDYHYHRCRPRIIEDVAAGRLQVDVTTPRAAADISCSADIRVPTSLPEHSCFHTEHEARRFAGPLPYTFAYEAATNSTILIKAQRMNWRPMPVRVQIHQATFFEHLPFAMPAGAIGEALANAFYAEDIPYGWLAGTRHALPGRST